MVCSNSEQTNAKKKKKARQQVCLNFLLKCLGYRLTFFCKWLFYFSWNRTYMHSDKTEWSLNSWEFLYKKLWSSLLGAKLLTAASFHYLIIGTVFSVGQEMDWCCWTFQSPSFSSGQDKPLSQRAALHRIHNFLACYKVIREKTKTRKTNTEAIILLMSLDREVWVTFSQRKLKVCKLTT